MARFSRMPLLALASLFSMVSTQAMSLQIQPKPCKNELGVPGTCMFVWDCIKTEGKHLGTCVDGFLFGSCCSHNDQSNIVPQPASSQVTRRPTITASHATSPGTAGTVSSKPMKPFLPSFSTSYVTPSYKPPSTQGHTSASTLKPSQHHTFKPPSGPVIVTASAESTRTTVSYGFTKPFVTGRPSWKPQKTSPRPTAPTRKPSTTAATSVSKTTTSEIGQTSQPTRTSSLYTTTKLTTTRRPTLKPQVTSATSSTTRRTTPTWPLVTANRETTTTKFPVKTTTKSTTSKPPFVIVFSPVSSVTYTPSVTSSTATTSKRTTLRPVIPSSTEAIATSVTTPKPVVSIVTTTTPKGTQQPTLPTFVISSLDTLFATRPSQPTRPTLLQEPWKPITNSPITTTTVGKKTTTTNLPPVSDGFTETTTTQDISCGVPTTHAQKKVVGGKNSAFGSWPWQASVRRTSFFGFSSTHRCGGALISNQWVATAGHCVDDLMISQIKIRVGEYDFSSVQEPYGYVEKGVKRKVVHPRYNFFTYENDLALVQLEDPIDTDKLPHISPICLPPDEQNLVGKNATVTGWGRLSEGGVLPSILQEVQVPVISNEKCKNMFLAAGRHEYIPDIFMCAGFEEGGRDSCQGDSGGPLQIQADDGRWFLAGIISWGIGCAEPNMPGVCTRISKFKDWVLQNIT